VIARGAQQPVQVLGRERRERREVVRGSGDRQVTAGPVAAPDRATGARTNYVGAGVLTPK